MLLFYLILFKICGTLENVETNSKVETFLISPVCLQIMPHALHKELLHKILIKTFLPFFLHSMRVLEMFGCFNITHVSLTILKDNCPNIETLNIGQCHKVVKLHKTLLFAPKSVLYSTFIFTFLI